jgi:hypothetical protein
VSWNSEEAPFPGTFSFPFIKEGPEERRKEMSGRKYALWAVAVSAALLTAGLSLSCGDDDNGAAVDCQAVCEKLDKCDDFIYGELGETVRECVDTCEEELAGAGEELIEALKCIPDADCREIMGGCLCPTVCEKLDECNMMEDMEDWNMAYCMYLCDYYFALEDAMCYYTFSSCQYVEMFCEVPEEP